MCFCVIVLLKFNTYQHEVSEPVVTKTYMHDHIVDICNAQYFLTIWLL